MTIKSFFVAALQSALDLEIATCDDVLKHVTPEILANHLPRPLWARLLTACVGAPRVDAQLVVETIGVPNLCEHMPSTIMWNCVEEIGTRAMGQAYVAKPVPDMAPTVMPLVANVGKASSSLPSVKSTPPPPPQPVERVPLSMAPPPEKMTPTTSNTQTQPSPTVAMGPEIPALDRTLGELFGDEERPATGVAGARGGRTPTGQRFRQSGTGIGRLAANSRRPQASASPPPFPDGRRAPTEAEYEVVTDVGAATASGDDWKSALAVEDEQLVDWAGTEETVSGNTTDDSRRKR